MSSPNLQELRRDIEVLPNDSERAEMLQAFGEIEQMESDNRRVDDMAAKLRAEQERRKKKTYRLLVLAIPLFSFGAYLMLQRVIEALSSNLAKARMRMVSRSIEPLYYWFIVLTELVVTTVLVGFVLWALWRLLAPNISVERDDSPKSGSRPSH